MSGARYDPAREFLESVKEARFEQNRSYRKFVELDAQCQSITSKWADTPGGGQEDPHKDALWAALADQRDQFWCKYRMAKLQEQEVEQFISTLGDPVHRAILTLRYVDLLPWPRVVDELEQCGIFYSARQIFRLHGDALQSARTTWIELHPEEGTDE